MQWVMERLLDLPEKGRFSDFSPFSFSHQLLYQQPDIAPPPLPTSPPVRIVNVSGKVVKLALAGYAFTLTLKTLNCDNLADH